MMDWTAWKVWHVLCWYTFCFLYCHFSLTMLIAWYCVGGDDREMGEGWVPRADIQTTHQTIQNLLGGKCKTLHLLWIYVDQWSRQLVQDFTSSKVFHWIFSYLYHISYILTYIIYHISYLLISYKLYDRVSDVVESCVAFASKSLTHHRMH